MAELSDEEIYKRADEFISAHINRGELEISTTDLVAFIKEVIDGLGK